MKLYAAIDVHSDNNVLAVIDEQDRVLFDRRLPNDLAVVLSSKEGPECAFNSSAPRSRKRWVLRLEFTD